MRLLILMRTLLALPLLLLATLVVSTPAWAQESNLIQEESGAQPTSQLEQGVGSDDIDVGIDEISAVLKLSDEDPRTIAVRLINAALGFLATITVIMLLWGGFQFLLSGGQEDKTERAGATIRNALIGLVIILSSWGAVRYILQQLVDVTTS
jgi:hypothetical protein